MIERLLAADAALERGEADVAERLFAQVAEADPRNAIAVVGLARLAIGRDDREGATTWLRRALEIDPQEAAAIRLLAALEAPAAPALPEAAPAGMPPPAAPGTAARRPSLLERFLRRLGLRRA